jgi:hypothetical protein
VRVIWSVMMSGHMNTHMSKLVTPYPPLPHSLTYSLPPSHIHTFTYSHIHLLTHSLTHTFTYSLPQSLPPSLPHSLTPSLTSHPLALLAQEALEVRVVSVPAHSLPVHVRASERRHDSRVQYSSERVCEFVIVSV